PARGRWQGRMAGVNVTQNTGVPGGGFDIEIRGRNSLRPDANAPLYIIDGVPYSAENTGSFQTSTIFNGSTSPLNSINPDAIESIEVLKDADATAIYGSRGSNGVVLITTKKGKAGKTQVTVNASSGAAKVARFMKLMDTSEYIAMREQAFLNDGFTELPDYAYDLNGAWERDRYTNWQKELIGGTALFNSLDGTVSGGNDRTQFLLGASYHTETTVFPGDFTYRKGGVNLNVNHSSEDGKFRVSATANYVAQDNNQPSYDLTGDSRMLAPNAPALYNPDGSLNWQGSTWTNPLANLNARFTSRTNDLVENTVMQYEVLKGLNVKGSIGYTETRNQEIRTMPSTIYDPAFGLGPMNSAVFRSEVQRKSWIAEPQLTYDRDFGRLAFNLVAGGSFQQLEGQRLTLRGAGFSTNALINDISASASQRIMLDNKTVYKYQAFFGRMNFNYDKRYIVNLTARRDGSSRFGPGRQFANFGAVGAAWLFSNEAVLKESSVL
ncbi:MAG: SusC/RagA family TonB-linked outer membrane protein, partial [Sphingobacteriales bacterium]